MMKRIFVSLALVMGIMMGVVATQPVWAVPEQDDVCKGLAEQKDKLGAQYDELRKAAGCDEGDTADKLANNLIQLAMGVVSVVAVGTMIFGGYQYVISNGNPSKLEKAKHILMYGLIGLIVTTLAYTIVNFIISAAAA